MAYRGAMSWVTVSAAAEMVGRSPQWIRNQIHTGALPAHTQPAGSRQRLLIMPEDLERLVARLQIEPIVAPAAPTPARSAAPPSDLTVNDVVAPSAMAENERLKNENAQLKANNLELREKIRVLQSIAHQAIDGFAPPGGEHDAITG
jgi:hypothetical protein